MYTPSIACHIHTIDHLHCCNLYCRQWDISICSDEMIDCQVTHLQGEYEPRHILCTDIIACDRICDETIGKDLQIPILEFQDAIEKESGDADIVDMFGIR